MAAVIIAPATSHRLTTISRAREMCGFSFESDRAAWLAIDQASAAAEHFCNRTFGIQTLRQRFDLRCGLESVVLDAWPVTQIINIGQDGTVLAPDAYEIDGIGLYPLRDGDRCRWHGRTLTVEYVAGYVLPDDEEGPIPAGLLPADIERAVILLVNAALATRQREAGLKSETIEGIGSFSYFVQGSNNMLPDPEAESLLRPHRKAFFA